MTVGQLRQEHIEVFGEESRSNHKQLLFRRIAWRIQALAEGGLSERARRRAMEIANDADLRIEVIGNDLPRSNHEASLLLMQMRFGWVTSSEEFTRALTT